MIDIGKKLIFVIRKMLKIFGAFLSKFVKINKNICIINISNQYECQKNTIFYADFKFKTILLKNYSADLFSSSQHFYKF
jgi:hypothetical protein